VDNIALAGKSELDKDSYMPKKYLMVQEVARLLGVTPLTVRNWDAKGKLVAYRNPVNNYRMYKVEDVETLIRRIETSRDAPRARKIDIVG
jgi:excisionase family DNA binding protein